jgi:hypothetical protein
MGISNIGVCMLKYIFKFGGPQNIFMTQNSYLFVDGITWKMDKHIFTRV